FCGQTWPERWSYEVRFLVLLYLDDVRLQSVSGVLVDSDEPVFCGLPDWNGKQESLQAICGNEVLRKAEGFWIEWTRSRRCGRIAGGLVGLRSSRTKCLVPCGDRVGRLVFDLGHRNLVRGEVARCRHGFSLRSISGIPRGATSGH